MFRHVCTCGGCPPRCGSVAVDYGCACVTVRRTEGRRCIVVEGEPPPGVCGTPSLGHYDNAGVKEGCHDSTVALGCGWHGSAEVQAEGRGQGWRAVLSSGHYGMFGGSRFLPREESSAQTHYRLKKPK